MKDEWFFQKDIEQQFIEFQDWNGKLVPVFEQRDSYVESFQAFCLPIPHSRLRRTFEEPSWIGDHTCSRVKIFRDTSKHFLSRAIRNQAGNIELLSMFHRFYREEVTERVIAKRECHDDQAHRHKRILICPVLLARFLAQKRQALLWCVSSIRFTERGLDEFATDSYEECIKQKEGIYIRSANLTTEEGKIHLPRMKSASRVWGKRRIHEIDRYA